MRCWFPCRDSNGKGNKYPRSPLLSLPLKGEGKGKEKKEIYSLLSRQIGKGVGNKSGASEHYLLTVIIVYSVYLNY